MKLSLFTVQAFLRRIEAGEDRGSIYKSIGVHRSTIPGVMRRLGYQLSTEHKNGGYVWEWKGIGEEPLNYNLLSGGNRATSDMPALVKDSAMIAKANTRLEKASKMLAENKNTNKIKFISDKEEKEKSYRGYYLDAETVEIMDKIKNKSEVVNDALREYFRNQGIL